MASAQFLTDFFPATVRLIERSAPWLLDHVFPDWARAQCPELQLALPHAWATTPAFQMATLRNPTLLPHQLTGAAVGLWGAARLAARPGHGLWALAFAYFSLMNLSSIFCHVLLPRQTPGWRLAASVDVAFTGASALTLALAAHWDDNGRLASSSSSSGARDGVGGGKAGAAGALPQGPMAQGPCRRYVVGYAAGVTPALLALAVAGNAWSVPFVNESLYIAPVLLAVVVLSSTLGTRCASPGYVPWMAPVAFGAIGLAAAAVLGERLLCRWAGPGFGMVQAFFLGCDAAFFGIGKFLLAQRPAQQPVHAVQATAERFEPPGERFFLSPPRVKDE